MKESDFIHLTHVRRDGELTEYVNGERLSALEENCQEGYYPGDNFRMRIRAGNKPPRNKWKWKNRANAKAAKASKKRNRK